MRQLKLIHTIQEVSKGHLNSFGSVTVNGYTLQLQNTVVMLWVDLLNPLTSW